MAKARVIHTTKLEAKEAFNKISQLLENDAEIRKLDSDYKCHFDEKKLRGTAEGKQFKAELNIDSKGELTTVEIEVSLPFHLALAKGMIEKTLRQKLEKILG